MTLAKKCSHSQKDGENIIDLDQIFFPHKAREDSIDFDENIEDIDVHYGTFQLTYKSPSSLKHSFHNEVNWDKNIYQDIEN